jgi:hypothetical protein
MVGEGNDTVKRKKPDKKPPRKGAVLNLSGVKFEDALRVMLRTPAPVKPKR